jgi:hypothetical protein
MSDAIMSLWLGLRAAVQAGRDQHARPVVPEPEFKPFQLPSRHGALPAPARAQADGIPAANTTDTPRTLEELGVPRPLASDIEATLRVMGMVDGDRIVGFTFRTPDGATHALRAGRAVGATDQTDRAA